MKPRKHRSRTPRGENTRANTGNRRDRFWIYGWHAVMAALANSDRRCYQMIATETAYAEMKRRVGESLGRQNLAIAIVPRSELARALAPGAVHQGVALEADPLPDPSLDVVCRPRPDAEFRTTRPPATVVVLDRVTDPRNVGAVLRAAAAFDAQAVVVTARHAPRESGALAKAASGALETVPLVRVTNLARALGDLKRLGYWCVGLEANAPSAIADANPGDAVALVLGAEGEGLRRLTRERCDLLLCLPIGDRVESLNVASAAAVALYALANPGRNTEA